MYFESVASALQMDGHGGFVWSAYAISLLVVVALVFVPKRREKLFLRQLKGAIRRQQGEDS